MSSLFKFRKYKKVEGGTHKRSKHPKLIVDETREELGFIGLTESPKRGNHKNIPLDKNPKKGDKRPAYIGDELRYDKKTKFEEILKDYNLSDKDIDKILKYVKKQKKEIVFGR